MSLEAARIEETCITETCTEGHPEKQLETPSFSFPGKISFRSFRRQKDFPGKFNWGGILLFAVFLCMALFPALFAPYAPKERFMPYGAPSEGHLLGTNDIGNDILSELVYGARISMTLGFAAALLSTILGTILGLCAGYFRGATDELLMGFTDVVLIIPKIPLIIVLGAFLKPSIWILIPVLGLLSWESTARVTRSKTLQLREAGYVKSARCMGFSAWHIMVSDIFPNIVHVLLPKFMLATASAMISEASLSFLGLSDISMRSWGSMLSFAFFRGGFIRDMWWWYMPPGICITLCVMSIAMVGFGLETKGEKYTGGGASTV
ncbi:ABC transporter permease subunit [Methanosarcina sp. DH2]|uniref:ABC transporter permease n=1 Tax=Methanosarcina sp. DH2 TaxID=2605639 RepID=UPI001E563C90|nr:ABC transporter permease [Methanosarcina sp. DH2]MCC4770129.1 ABC transporter permease subunit [Methanosarcina sp. DH2]